MAETGRERLEAATPRPWRLDGGSASRALIYGGIKPGRSRTLVCEIDTSWESDVAAAEAVADAELIVCAVNEYEALLEIAEAAAKIADGRESEAARESYRAGLGVSEWRAMLTRNEDALFEALARLDGVRRG